MTVLWNFTINNPQITEFQLQCHHISGRFTFVQTGTCLTVKPTLHPKKNKESCYTQNNLLSAIINLCIGLFVCFFHLKFSPIVCLHSVFWTTTNNLRQFPFMLLWSLWRSVYIELSEWAIEWLEIKMH